MSTSAQIQANQLNAQLSTGPRTANGKSTSAQNATKHGLASAYPVIRSDEERAQFESMTASFEYEIRPGTQTEMAMFKQLIHAAWNIDRCHRLEADLSTNAEIDPLLDETAFKTLARIEAYRTRAERTFHKALKELKANRPYKKFQDRPLESTPQNKPKYFHISSDTYVRDTPKTGRNEPCPCNSGKKFKFCCLNGGSSDTQTAPIA